MPGKIFSHDRRKPRPLSASQLIRLTFDPSLRWTIARYRIAKQILRNAQQRMQYRNALFLYQRRLEPGLARNTLGWIRDVFATLIALFVATSFAFTLPEAFIDSPNFKVSEVHLACAGIIGTALALVLTLSIVPAQKAADVFSSAILKLYARDRQLFIVFILLSCLVLISVLFGTNWTFYISARYTLAAQIVVMGVMLDALRRFMSVL